MRVATTRIQWWRLSAHLFTRGLLRWMRHGVEYVLDPRALSWLPIPMAVDEMPPLRLWSRHEDWYAGARRRPSLSAALLSARPSPATYSGRYGEPSRVRCADRRGREVAHLEPTQGAILGRGLHEALLVRYYLAVADGALRAAGNRPNVLVRYPNGTDGEFLSEARTRITPALDRCRRAEVSLRPDGRGSGSARRSRAGVDGESGMPRAPSPPCPRR